LIADTSLSFWAGHPVLRAFAQRISELLRWFGLEHRSAQVETLETDFLKPFCGLTMKSYQALCSERAGIIH
jgi:hypothetical protein